MRYGSSGELRDERVGVEALEPERRDQLGVRPVATSSATVVATIGVALKPYVPQPQLTKKPSSSARRRSGCSRADVAEARPRAQDVDVLELREELEHRRRRVSRKPNVPVPR